jgi:hypothetical protein
MQEFCANPEKELCSTCAFVTAESCPTLANVPEHDVPRPVTPLQQTTLPAYAAVDWLGNSACAFVAADMRSITVFVPPVHAAAVVMEQERVPAKADAAVTP